MNERILKLFTQACYHGDYEPENVPSEVVEKFAELIVKECAKKANAIALDIRINSNLDARKYVGDSILKSFGVE